MGENVILFSSKGFGRLLLFYFILKIFDLFYFYLFITFLLFLVIIFNSLYISCEIS